MYKGQSMRPVRVGVKVVHGRPGANEPEFILYLQGDGMGDYFDVEMCGYGQMGHERAILRSEALARLLGVQLPSIQAGCFDSGSRTFVPTSLGENEPGWWILMDELHRGETPPSA